MGQFLEVILSTTHHFPLNHLIGLADGHCLKLVMNFREKGTKCAANLAVHCEKEEQKALVSYAVTDIQITPALS